MSGLFCDGVLLDLCLCVDLIFDFVGVVLLFFLVIDNLVLNSFFFDSGNDFNWFNLNVILGW